MNATGNAPSPPELQHALRIWDPLGRRRWLVPPVTPVPDTLIPDLDPRVEAWVLTGAELRTLPRTPRCAPCAQGDPCARWSRAVLLTIGYQGRAEGARRAPPQHVQLEFAALEAHAAQLGLAWPSCREDVQRAFRAGVRVHHPDHGGDGAVLQQWVLARDALLRALDQLQPSEVPQDRQR